MNIRVIQKILKKKYDEWLDSIEDKNTRKLAKDNGIITGGSIVSLLLNEKVNDYDIYFKDEDTVIAVAEYYIKKFNQLNPNLEIPPRLSCAGDPQRIKIIVQSAGITSENGDVGYQYFEQLPDEIGQDWFENAVSVADEEDSEMLEDKKKPKYRPIFMSSNAITLSDKIQIVIRFYGNPDEIHRNYDYAHCCNYWESSDEKLTLNPAALTSIITKNLQYQGSLYPVCSVIRMRKFLKQGWYINAGQILKMLFQISELDLTNIDVLEEQLTGVDAAYFFQVIEYCKKRKEEQPDFEVTTPYLVSIIDKIFG